MARKAYTVLKITLGTVVPAVEYDSSIIILSKLLCWRRKEKQKKKDTVDKPHRTFWILSDHC